MPLLLQRAPSLDVRLLSRRSKGSIGPPGARMPASTRPFQVRDRYPAISGSLYFEHDEKDSADKKYRALWSSIDNPRSFWLTQSSLCNALDHAGFSSVFVQMNPSLEKHPLDRHTIIAMKGSPARILSSPVTDQQIRLGWTEKTRIKDGPPNLQRSLAFRLSKRYRPQPIKKVIKSVAWKLGLMKKVRFPEFNQLLPANQRAD